MPELSPGLRLAWSIAQVEARKARSDLIEPEHLFIGICKVANALDVTDWSRVPEARRANLLAEAKRVFDVFQQARVERVDLYRTIRRLRKLGSAVHPEKQAISRSETSRAAFAAAIEFAGTRKQVDSLDLLGAVLTPRSEALAGLLTQLGVDIGRLKTAALSNGPREERGALDSILLKYGRDLTDLARQGSIRECVGRRRELLQLVRTLSRVTKNNPVLVGDPGVGKTAIVEGLAWRIAKGKSLTGKRIIELSVGELLAGATYRGEFEERLQGVVREVKQQPDVIVFIDEIHTLVRAGAVEHGALDAANILKPALARGELRCIGATTSAEYERYFAKDAAFERRFLPITVLEPSPDEAAIVLRAGYVARFEAEYRVKIEAGVPEAAVQLSVDYLPSRRLPDKAIDLLDEACATVVVPALSAMPGEDKLHPIASVTTKTLAAVVSEWTGIPAQELIL